ncbi:MAG: 5'-3' exonuclease H3TH domain-containing protein, partial [Gammaproteobacteria bacterium]
MAHKLLVLVDGSSYLYRAFHALPALTNSAEHPTGAMHGVLAMLRRLRQDFDADYFAVVFDPRGPTLRDEWYPEYKANRPPMPDELACQIEPLHRIIRAQGIPLLQVDGVEADDVIGTLASAAADAGMDVVISTGDKDFAQLVDNHVTLVNTMDNTTLDTAAVQAKFGVRPDQIVDYLTLVGDTVDNIPGVPKVGPKTAAKWLQQYGTLDELVAHADEVKGKIGDNLRSALEQLPLSRRLVTILRDVELDTTVNELVPAAPDQASLLELYRSFEFSTWLKELGQDGVDLSAAAADRNGATAAEYACVLDETALDEWLEALGSAELFAFDTET